MSDNSQREKQIFSEALELDSPEEQHAFLRAACGGDESLRQAVESLLEAYAQAGGFIPDRLTDSDEPPSDPAPSEGPGTLLGRYKLLEQIGEGGCGVVYVAEQEQHMRRRVALKVIKLGMDTRSVIARFEAERQALAMMDHPNIAKVLDAGTTQTGRPFFVMELVRGVKITDYCDQHQLSTRERLDLFVQVCRAVQHAHQKGIIHRDLKPSNILVTVNDGLAVPKVIDFGIAKATEGRLTDKTVYTELHQFIGTPAYMSPEQAERTSVDIDTRSDIYSLGVLLYELLTEKTPFEQKELLKAGLDAMRKTIRTQEPPCPSTRLSTLGSADLTRIAQARASQPPQLVHLVRGDLDWIVMKCLEKDRARRYESANDLAVDLQRHVEGEPVTAAPPTRLYRISKWVRKNRGFVMAGSSVGAAIICGLVISFWQWSVARRNEGVARSESLKSAQTARFLADMLRGVNPSMARGEDTKLLRRILEDTQRRLGRDLKDQPDVEADLRSILGDVYLSLGNYSNAAAMYNQALVLRRSLFGPKHVKVSDSLSNLGDIAWRQGLYPEAEQFQTQALEMLTNLVGSENARVADSLDGLGKIWWYAGKWPQAEGLLRKALAMRRKLLGDKHPDTVKSLDDLAGLLSAEDKFPDAEPLQREALRLNQQLLGADDPSVAVSLNNLSDTLDAEGKLAESESLARDALTLRKRVLGAEHPDYAHSLFELGNVLRDEGKFAEAEAKYRESLAIRRHDFGETNLDVADSLNNLGAALVNENRPAEAEPLIGEALGIQRALLPALHQDIAGSLLNLAATLTQEGKLGDAETVQREALAMQQRLLGEHLNVATSFYNLAFLLEADGKLAEAETNAAQSLAIRQKLLGNEHSDVATTMALLARIRSERHDLNGAEALQRLEVEIWRKLVAKNSPPLPISVAGMADSLARFTQTLLALGRYSDAEAPAREADAFTEKAIPENWQRFRARSLLGSVLAGEHKLTEAEPLLMTGYEGLARLAASIPPEDSPAIAEAVRRLVSYYTSAGQAEKVAEWNQKLRDAKKK